MANTNESIIDAVMGFNPADAVAGVAFQTEKTGQFNKNIYKTNPASQDITLVSEDGHYYSKVKVLMNPFNLDKPKAQQAHVVHQARYNMRDAQGFFTAVSSLSVGDKECPLFKGFKKLHYARIADEKGQLVEDTEKVEWAKKMFDKSESDWCLVQVIEDENRPDLVGQILMMKLPKAIMNRLQAKMNPTDKTKTKQPLMDYIFGPVLEMNVVPGPDDPSQPSRKSREVSYDLCDFATDPTPIIKTDGTQFFTDEEIELIDEYNNYQEAYNKALSDAAKAKTETLKNKAVAKMEEAEGNKEALRSQIRPLYARAIEYVKANALNLEAEVANYHWDAQLTARVNAWLTKVLAMKNPEILDIDEEGSVKEQPAAEKQEAAPEPAPTFSAAAPGDDLPF